jgi:probable HAF family extracellular repeat protein
MTPCLREPIAAALLFACAAFAPDSVHAAPVFVELVGDSSWADVATTPTSVGGVSADGSHVVGQAMSPSGRQAALWTVEGTLQPAPSDLPGGFMDGYASAATPGGTVVVGESASGAGYEAFRWSDVTGMVPLGDLVGGGSTQLAYDVSADGSVVVGRGWIAGDSSAFRWTSTGGAINLGTLVGSGGVSTAVATSADGSVVVGQSSSAAGPAEGFVWTAATGMLALGDLEGGLVFSTALGISADASVIVGYGQSVSGQEAVRWIEGEILGLGDLPGGAFRSFAEDTSADGSLIVGQGRTASGNEAFLWDPAHGMRLLAEVLTNDYGLDLTGWTLVSAMAISDDGLTIAGNGINPSGVQRGWVAVIPEPSTALLVALGGVGLALRRV